MTIEHVRYYLSPPLIVLIGVGAIAFGVLAIIFRKQVRDFTVANHRLMFGNRIANKSQAAPMWNHVVACCGFIAIGGVFVVLGIIGVVTNAHVYPQPS